MSLRRAALACAARGVPVFPCAPDGKRPIVEHGLHDASTDPDAIDRWWQREPRANLGVPTGPRSGFVVLDVDTKGGADGFATLADLERAYGPLPATLASATPSGGEHRWFRATGAVIRNSAGRVAGEDAPGIDWRGCGGYVVAPPSVIGGRGYSWRARIEAAELPSRWIEALRPASREPAPVATWTPRSVDEGTRVERWCLRALQHEARELATAPRGTRNDRLWRSSAALAGLVHTGAIDATDIRRALEWACSQWSERDARKDADTLERGLSFGLANPRPVRLEDRRAA